MTAVTYDYTPTPKQALLHSFTAVDEILYGGAAGGGKSRAGRAEAIRMATMVPGSLTYVFRRTFPQLQQDVIPKFRAEMPSGIARYNSSEHTWFFTNGSRIILGHMQNENDYEDYLGAEPQLIVWEELTQFLEVQYRMVRGRLRSAGAVLRQLEQLGWKRRSIGTTNPGGVGHSWVKERFVDPGVTNRPWQPTSSDEEENPGRRVFIPAKLADNPHMDPGYAQVLDNLEPVMRAAYRDGDWDILKGVRFTQFRRSVHVVEPEEVPLPIIGIPRGVGVDYGMVDPWCALWGAVLPDMGFGRRLVVYRELYGPGYTAEQQSAMIKAAEAEGEREPSRPIPLALDPSMWSRPSEGLAKGGKGAPPGSVAWYYENQFGSAVTRARNERIAGWSLIDELLRVRGDGLPGVLFYSTCTNLIRELPSQQRSKKNPEDLVATGVGHADACDAFRYLAQLLIGGGHDRTSSEPQHAVVTSITGELTAAQF